MLRDTLIALFTRDLEKLQLEINAYRQEDNIWKLTEGISNSAGNLCLHLVGNLNHFIGAVLGETGYVRNRDLEFASKNLPRHDLIEMVKNTIHVINSSLNTLSQEALEKEYPLVVLGNTVSTEYFLVHLSTHLSYHLGQINYHRRLLDV